MRIYRERITAIAKEIVAQLLKSELLEVETEMVEEVELERIGPILHECEESVPADHDALGLVPVGCRTQQRVRAEQGSSNQEKLDQGIPYPGGHPCGQAARLGHGVYQIGDERARSWITEGRAVASAGS